MLDAHPEHRKSLMAGCVGTWDLAVLGGTDQRGNPFVTMLSDPMAGGFGARVDQDGVDTGGLHTIPMGRVADVEINEYSFPILYLWRREEIDSAGAGRFRGGAGGSSCIIPYDSPDAEMQLVASATGKALPQATGLAGGYPAGTQHNVLFRQTPVRDLFRSGRIPASLDEIGGTQEILEQHLEITLNTGDAYYLHWQGGGGYGDPLARESAAVVRDVTGYKVSRNAAETIYGVVLNDNGELDEEETQLRRATLRRERVGLLEEAAE
jgi:N-methylhydantoinase B